MRQALVAVLALAALIVVAAPASAAVNNGLIKDCADDGRIDGSYSRGDLRDTLDGLPVDVEEYTNCRSAINGALRRAVVRRRGRDIRVFVLDERVNFVLPNCRGANGRRPFSVTVRRIWRGRRQQATVQGRSLCPVSRARRRGFPLRFAVFRQGATVLFDAGVAVRRARSAGPSSDPLAPSAPPEGGMDASAECGDYRIPGAGSGGLRFRSDRARRA